MQNRDAYKLLYNNLWLHKSGQSATVTLATNTTTTAAINAIATTSATIKTAQQIIDKSDATQSILPKPVNVVTPVELQTCHTVPRHGIQIIEQRDNLVSPTNNISNNTDHSPNPAGPIEPTTLIDNWDTLVSDITNCAKCGLCHSRQNVVIERGSRVAKWMFVGEGPGAQEDLQGKPFVGASGQLLQKMIGAMKLDPENDVYICNVVKCRPPANRNPEPEEIKLCKNYLFSQIELVKPQIIITLGRFAYQTLLNTDVALGRLRLQQHYYQKTPLIVTYHPAYLLRNPSAKKDAWADLQLAMQVFKDTISV